MKPCCTFRALVRQQIFWPVICITVIAPPTWNTRKGLTAGHTLTSRHHHSQLVWVNLTISHNATFGSNNYRKETGPNTGLYTVVENRCSSHWHTCVWLQQDKHSHIPLLFVSTHRVHTHYCFSASLILIKVICPHLKLEIFDHILPCLYLLR